MKAVLRTALQLGTAVLLAWAAPVAGAQPGPEWLPPFPGPVPAAAERQPLSRVGWQLHQQLDWDVPGGRGRLGLSPAVTVTVHDPQAAARQELDRLQLAHEARSRAEAAAAETLLLHRLYLQLQHNTRLAELTRHWRAHLAAAHGAAGAAAARRQLTLTGLDLRLGQLSAHADLLRLRLELAGVPPDSGTAGLHMPAVSFPDEPLPACLGRNLTLGMLELLEQTEQLQAEHDRAGKRLKVEARAGLTLGISGGGRNADPLAAGWDLGLTVSQADFAGPALSISAGNHGLSQTLSVRSSSPPEGAAEPDGSVYAGLRDEEAFRLLSLFDALTAAADSEALAAAAAQLALRELDDGRAGTAARERLILEAYEAALEQLQLQEEHDQLLLEVASACRFPLTWLPEEPAGRPPAE